MNHARITASFISIGVTVLYWVCDNPQYVVYFLMASRPADVRSLGTVYPTVVTIRAVRSPTTCRSSQEYIIDCAEVELESDIVHQVDARTSDRHDAGMLDHQKVLNNKLGPYPARNKYSIEMKPVA